MQRVILAAGLTLYIASVAAGQTISGAITDEIGNPIENASVRLDSRNGSPIAKMQTGPDGSYLFQVTPSDRREGYMLSVLVRLSENDIRRANAINVALDQSGSAVLNFIPYRPVHGAGSEDKNFISKINPKGQAPGVPGRSFIQPSDPCPYETCNSHRRKLFHR